VALTIGTLSFAEILKLHARGATIEEIEELAGVAPVAASTPVKRAASPKAKAVKPNGFIGFLTTRKVARLAEGDLVPCGQKGCTGTMSAARTTTKRGKAACKRHF
jgi:hypothetical protein